jgi:hypothetical protein
MGIRLGALIIILLLSIPSYAFCDVSVRDDLSVSGKPLMLSAVTKGRFLRSGGELVEFFVSGESLGRTLSGGDGVAYMEYVPQGEGLYELKVLMGEYSGGGLLRVARKGSAVLLIEVSGSLMEDLLERKSREGAREALDRLSQDFVVVYVQEVIPKVKVREWLDKNEFVRAPLFSLKAGRLVKHIMSRGFRIAAAVGSAGFADNIKDESIRRFSFQRSERSEKVASWGDLADALSGGD